MLKAHGSEHRIRRRRARVADESFALSGSLYARPPFGRRLERHSMRMHRLEHGWKNMQLDAITIDSRLLKNFQFFVQPGEVVGHHDDVRDVGIQGDGGIDEML